MQAVEVSEFGGPEVLQAVERPAPEVGAGQVLIEVEVAEVLFLDTQLRAGWGQEFFAMKPPFVPGAGVAGVVREVGAGVDGALVGRTVIAGTGGVGTYLGGGYAELAVVPADECFEVPAGLESATALAALHDGATALAQLDLAKVSAGERVLVNGATGSLGQWLVPLLAEAGATVIAGVRGAAKVDRARRMGAAEAVDYSGADWTEQLGRLDVVFDAAGGDIGRAAFEQVVEGGRFLAYGSASGSFAEVTPELAAARGVTLSGIYQPDPVAWRQLPVRALTALADGTVQPVVGQEYMLTQAAEAHRAIGERRTTGKTVLLTGLR